jgi:hypothetical protein
MKPDTILYLDDHRGIYIPQNFAECTKRECVSGVSDEDWAILEAGPDHEHYWEAWESVCDSAKLTDPSDGTVYHIYQDGACWLVPVGMEWDDKSESYYWPEESDE